MATRHIDCLAMDAGGMSDDEWTPVPEATPDQTPGKPPEPPEPPKSPKPLDTTVARPGYMYAAAAAAVVAAALFAKMRSA